MEKYSMFIDKKAQYCQIQVLPYFVNSVQSQLKFQQAML